MGDCGGCSGAVSRALNRSAIHSLSFPNLRPDFPYKAVCLLDIPVQFAFLGGNTFLLHLASRHAHVDGGYLANAALGVAAVVDTLRASGSFKVGV